MTSLRSTRRGLLAVALALATGGALALTINDTTGEKGVDPAAPRKPLLAPPKPATPPPPAAPLPDTSALLPSGDYNLVLTFKGEAVNYPIKIGRQGGAVNGDVAGTADFAGTLDPAGHLVLTSGRNADKLTLNATVQNRRAQGSASLGRGAQRIDGSFSLEPVTGARKLQDFDAKKQPKKEGFWERMGKLWDCLTNWSTC